MSHYFINIGHYDADGYLAVDAQIEYTDQIKCIAWVQNLYTLAKEHGDLYQSTLEELYHYYYDRYYNNSREKVGEDYKVYSRIFSLWNGSTPAFCWLTKGRYVPEAKKIYE